MKYSQDAYVTVAINVNDQDVIDRVVNDVDDWQGTYYRMGSASEVLDHLAYNCIANGVERVNRLDGWADLADDAATMRIEGVEPA
jgi:hypothetical protein